MVALATVCCNYWQGNFGGTGMNIMNVALITRMFLFSPTHPKCHRFSVD
jgi:Na+-transporting NADH:ubiquinone oxidoreductase subunit NqrB